MTCRRWFTVRSAAFAVCAGLAPHAGCAAVSSCGSPDLAGGARLASPAAAPATGGFPQSHMDRILYWEGVDNVRDFGGLQTVNGRTVRRGLVFRSQALNDNAISGWLTAERLERKIRRNEFLVECGRGNGGEILRRIGTNELSAACAAIAAQLSDGTNGWKKGEARGTPRSRRRILDETRLRTEIDLRNKPEVWGMNGSPLGPSVIWRNIPCDPFMVNPGSPAGKEGFKRCFAIFLDEYNYPIDFHCIAGADRTGILAAVLEALLGVSESDIVIDYTLTSLSTSGIRRSGTCEKLLAAFDKYPGTTLNERVEAYAIDCGFTRADIAKFRAIMLEE